MENINPNTVSPKFARDDKSSRASYSFEDQTLNSLLEETKLSRTQTNTISDLISSSIVSNKFVGKKANKKPDAKIEINNRNVKPQANVKTENQASINRNSILDITNNEPLVSTLLSSRYGSDADFRSHNEKKKSSNSSVDKTKDSKESDVGRFVIDESSQSFESSPAVQQARETVRELHEQILQQEALSENEEQG